MFSLFLISLFVVKTQAWWDGGHLLIATTAMNDLKDTGDSNIIVSMDALLNDTALFFPNVSDFVSVAVWADDLHSRFGTKMFSEWHFANKAFVVNNSVPQPAPLKAENNVWSTLKFCKKAMQRIEDGSADEGRFGQVFVGAWCLRWLIHVVGDSHQPLHVTDMYDKALPTGDRGGNLCKVKVTNKPDITNLHAVWDSVGGLYDQNYLRPLTAGNRSFLEKNSASLVKAWPKTSFTKLVLENMDFGAWINESYAIGVKVGYQNGLLQCNSTLNQTYLDAVQEAASQRLALGGYRLAALLRDIAPKTYSAVLPTYCEQLEEDATRIKFSVDSFTFYCIMGGAVFFLLLLLLIFFCFGRARGRAMSGGPRFERLN